MNRYCSLIQIGLVEYGEAFRFQRAVAAARESGSVPDTLILLEHPPVLTLGRRANESNILVAEELLRFHGVSVYHSSRGGDVTYHGPGQIVGYPILHLRQLKLGVAQYVHDLERAIIGCLRHFGVEGNQDREHIGVWVGDDKIAAIGVAVSRGVTLHGFALNVEPNLAHFQLINPCGITDRGVTSLSRLLGRAPTLDEVRRELVRNFSEVLGLEVVPCDPRQLESAGLALPSEESKAKK